MEETVDPQSGVGASLPDTRLLIQALDVVKEASEKLMIFADTSYAPSNEES